MQHLDLDYEDVGETAVTGRPTTDLHDLRAVLVTTNPIVGRRVERILTPMGARLSVIPDWGHVSIGEIRGLDPQLVLLEPDADLRSRADANRRLSEEPRLTWAVIDRIPRGLEGRAGVDRLIELAAVALGPDRQLQAEMLLARDEREDGFVAPIDALGPGRLLRALVLTEGTFEVRYEEDAVEASMTISDGTLIQASWNERGPEPSVLQGVAALTAFTALRQGEVSILPAAPKDGPGLGLLANALEEAAAPELSWVATRVATGRYLFPPPGMKPVREEDLPEASQTRRARPERLTVDVAPLAGSRTMPGVAGLPAVLRPEMPRMPRIQGPKAPVELAERQALAETASEERAASSDAPSGAEVAIASIVSVTPPKGVPAPTAAEDGEYDDMEVSSLQLDVEVEPPAPSIPPTQAMPVATPETTSVPSSPETPAPASVWPHEPAPVSAADSIRPALSPVQIPKRRIWPWSLAALALLGLVIGGGAAALLGSESLASYADDPGEIFAQIEDLDIDLGSLGQTGAPGAGGAAAASAPSTAAPTVVEPLVEEADEALAPDAEMVFELEEAAGSADRTNDDTREERSEAESPRRRRRALRRRARALLDEAYDAPSAEAAAQLYHEVLEIDRGNVRALRGLARAEMVMGNYPAAVRYAEEATRARPRDAASWGILGDIHRRAGNEDSAQRAYDRAAALEPDAEGQDPSSEGSDSEGSDSEGSDPEDAAPAAAAPDPAPATTTTTRDAEPSSPPDVLAPRRPSAGLPPPL